MLVFVQNIGIFFLKAHLVVKSLYKIFHIQWFMKVMVIVTYQMRKGWFLRWKGVLCVSNLVYLDIMNQGKNI
jgi:hypothetical protein